MEKPLFIPLKAEYFEAFERGIKAVEWRVYGPRWNEKTCRPGREVILSYGYGKARRLQGKIAEYRTVLKSGAPDHVCALLPHAEKFAATRITAIRALDTNRQDEQRKA